MENRQHIAILEDRAGFGTKKLVQLKIKGNYMYGKSKKPVKPPKK